MLGIGTHASALRFYCIGYLPACISALATILILDLRFTGSAKSEILFLLIERRCRTSGMLGIFMRRQL